jgi:hypothetical protein
MNKIKMDVKDEIKIEQINLKDNNKKYIHERNNASNKMSCITGSNIHLNFVSEEKNMDKLDNETTLLNNYKENKTISDNDNNIEIYFNNIQKRRQEEEEKEQKLIFFYHKLTGSYKNKNYQNIVREIENLKVLFRHSSEISLKLYILKMRCLLKTIKEQYYKLIIVNDQKINLTEIMKKIYKIKREFESLTDYINPYNLSNYEDIIQIYSKFLLYLSIVCKLREEYLKGMSYTTMGVNLMKIFFIRKKVAKSIKTYIIYCQLLLMLINSLICDKNYTTAIFYSQILFKVLNVFFKMILKKKLPKKYYLKFLEFTGINFLFTGICLEQNEIIYNNETCYYVYKQANYFLGLIDPKGKFNYIPKPNTTQQNDENRALILSQIILEKYKEMFDKEKILNKLLLNSNKENSIKKDKVIDMEIIENMRTERYKPIEDKIYNNILTQNTQNHIEKLDNELISVVYQQKDEQTMQPTTLSSKSKKYLYNFELYNILMSNNFRNYIIKSNRLHFNNPLKEKQSIESLQRYLNKNIKINDNSDLRSRISNKRNSMKLDSDNSLEKKKFNLKFLEKSNIKNQQKIILNKNIIQRYPLKNKSLSSHNIFSLKNIVSPKKNENSEKRTTLNPFISYNQKYNKSNKFIIERNISNKLLFSKNLHSEIDASKTLKVEKNINNDYFKLIKQNRKYKKIKNMNIKNISKREKWKNSPNFRYSNSYSFLENDFERKYLDKSLLSPRYFKKVSYLDSLIIKELSFQKTMLKLKGNSSKMYFGTYEKDLNLDKNNIDSVNNNKKEIKQNAYNTYLILNNKANEEVKKLKLEDYNSKRDPTNLLEYQNKVLKIFNKYIRTSKDKAAEKLRVYSESSRNVKRNNEVKLLNLNNGLKELNYIISYKNKQLKNFSFNKKIKIIN